MSSERSRDKAARPYIPLLHSLCSSTSLCPHRLHRLHRFHSLCMHPEITRAASVTVIPSFHQKDYKAHALGSSEWSWVGFLELERSGQLASENPGRLASICWANVS